MWPAIVAVPTSPGTALPRYQKVFDQSELPAPPSGADIACELVMPTACSGLFTPMTGMTTSIGTFTAGDSRLSFIDATTAEFMLCLAVAILPEAMGV